MGSCLETRIAALSVTICDDLVGRRASVHLFRKRNKLYGQRAEGLQCAEQMAQLLADPKRLQEWPRNGFEGKKFTIGSRLFREYNGERWAREFLAELSDSCGQKLLHGFGTNPISRLLN